MVPIREVGFASYFARRLQKRLGRRILGARPESHLVEAEIRRELANWALGRSDALGEALHAASE